MASMKAPGDAAPLSGQKSDEYIVCRHDFWRACYATMLTELSQGDIIAFFKALPMRLKGRDYSGAALLEHFWGERGEIPLAWNYLAVNALEPFLVENGYDAQSFIKKMFFRSNKSTYMPGKIVMSWIYPVMDSVFSIYDPREMIFHMIAIYTENYLPGHLHRRIKKSIEKDWTYSYLMYLGDSEFKRFRYFNFDYIAGEQIKAFPRMLNLPEFEEISYLADCRRLEEVIWEGRCETTSDGLNYQGRRIAGFQVFHAFAEAHGLDFRKYSLPDMEILVANEDVFCNRRKRVVVYKGCAYQAPAFISVVKHRKIGRKEKKFLEHMIADSLQDAELFSEVVIRKHRQLVSALKRKSAFVYRIQDESMTLNGEYFTKGIPAKILRHILSRYLSEGQTRFEYMEFKRESEISLGQKNSNFEVRFYRLVRTFAEKCPGIRIEKSDRGRFSLITDIEISFEEVA